MLQPAATLFRILAYVYVFHRDPLLSVYISDHVIYTAVCSYICIINICVCTLLSVCVHVRSCYIHGCIFICMYYEYVHIHCTYTYMHIYMYVSDGQMCMSLVLIPSFLRATSLCRADKGACFSHTHASRRTVLPHMLHLPMCLRHFLGRNIKCDAS